MIYIYNQMYLFIINFNYSVIYILKYLFIMNFSYTKTSIYFVYGIDL